MQGEFLTEWRNAHSIDQRWIELTIEQMEPTPTPSAAPPDPEPRWPAMLAILAGGGIYAAVPDTLRPGPIWMLPVIVGCLVVPTAAAHSRGAHRINMVLGHMISIVLTTFMVCSLVLLIRGLLKHTENPFDLLRSAISLWSTNVVVFALWYWRLDAGGPHARDSRDRHLAGAFLFPQMTINGPAALENDGSPWSPRFVDYLFLAFNTSTAFSPTDVPILSRWAKLLVMTQAVISLVSVTILIGRAVNIL